VDKLQSDISIMVTIDSMAYNGVFLDTLNKP